MPETAFDQSIAHCTTLIKQKQVLYDGLNRISMILQGPGNVTKEQLMEVITRTFKEEALTN